MLLHVPYAVCDGTSHDRRRFLCVGPDLYSNRPIDRGAEQNPVDVGEELDSLDFTSEI